MTRTEHNAEITTGLSVRLRIGVIKWVAACEAQGIQIWLVEGRRTAARQLELFKHGRAQRPDGTWYVVDQKQVLTNAMSAKDGPHPRGAAVDFCPMLDGVLAWKREDLFRKAGTLAKTFGMVWGGDFKSDRAKALGDLDHLEDPSWRAYPLPAALPVS